MVSCNNCCLTQNSKGTKNYRFDGTYTGFLDKQGRACGEGTCLIPFGKKVPWTHITGITISGAFFEDWDVFGTYSEGYGYT